MSLSNCALFHGSCGCAAAAMVARALCNLKMGLGRHRLSRSRGKKVKELTKRWYFKRRAHAFLSSAFLSFSSR